MKYKTLTKEYYKGAEAYNHLYQTRINSDECVHLDFNIHGNPAFFMETPELLKKIIRIERRKYEVAVMKNKLPEAALKQFARKTLIDEIVITNDIEGVNSTRREIEDILDDLAAKSKRNRFQGLVNKYIALQDSQAKISIHTCRDIRSIYDEIFLAEVLEDDDKNAPEGEFFRENPVYVRNARMEIIHQGVVPESNIISDMNKALALLENEDIDVNLKIGLFHYLFGYIHPFYDANGRMARFISSYMLAEHVEALLGYQISFTIKENLHDYYQAFKTCNDKKNKADLTPFVLMFTDVIEKSIEQLLEALTERYRKLIRSEAILSKHIADAQQEKMKPLYDYLLQAALFSESGIPLKTLLELLDIGRATLAKRLKTVEEHGLLITLQRGKEKYYQLKLDVIDAWAEEENAND